MKRIRIIICLLGLLALLCTSGRTQIVGPNGSGGGGTSPISPGSLTAPPGTVGTIAQYSVNGEVNVASPTYVANPRTSSVASTTATTNGTTASVTLGAANGFVNGEGIAIYGANTITSLGASVTPTVTQTGYTGAASGNTVTYTYQVSACDATYSCKAASAANVAVNGPSVLSHPNTANGNGVAGSGGNYNVLTGYSVASAVHYVIWRNRAGGGYQLWAVTDLTTFNDWANIQTMSTTSGPFTNTPLAADTGGVFATTILSGAGTTSVVLAGIPPIAGTWTAWPDATAAIQNAANALGTNGGKVYMPVGFYKVRTINPPTRVIFYGAGGARSASSKTILQGTSGFDIWAWTGSTAYADMSFRDFAMNGGRNAFYDNDTATVTNVTLEHLTASAYDFGGIECYKCPMEEWWAWDTYWANGWYGYNLEGDGTGTNYINKAHFNDTQYSSQAVNAIRIFENGFSVGGVTWLRTNVVGVRQDAIYIDGPVGVGGIDFNGYNDEGVGVDFGKTASTGTCTTSSNVITVAATTGLAIGQDYTVLGCGTNGDALEGTICACTASSGLCTGTTVTLMDPTCTTAVNAASFGVPATAQFSTNAIFDNAYFVQSSGAFQQVSIENAQFTDVGGCCGSAQTRFGLYAKGPLNLYNVSASKLESPFNTTNLFPVPGGAGPLLSSQTASAGGAFTAGVFSFPALNSFSGATTITSPKGNPFNIGMVDTVGDGSGTYGPFTIWNSRAAGKIKRFTIDPSGLGSFVAPTVNTTGVTAEPGTSGMALTATTAGVESYQATEFNISAGTNTFGLSSSYPTGTVIAYAVASRAGHFTNLMCQLSLFGTCTTAPIVNVFDGTSNTGTQLQCANNATQTKGAGTAATAQTQTFAAGDQIGIYVVTQGATCLADEFSISAEATTP